MRLAEQLRTVRFNRKLKQIDVAILLGVDQKTISRWERGGGVDPDYYPAIAEFLSVDVHTVCVWAHGRQATEDDLNDRVRELEDRIARLNHVLGERGGEDRGPVPDDPPPAPGS